VGHGFHIRRALAGALAGALPVGDGLGVQARLGVVLGQQLGLRRSDFRKLLLQNLRNALMVVLPSTF